MYSINTKHVDVIKPGKNMSAFYAIVPKFHKLSDFTNFESNLQQRFMNSRLIKVKAHGSKLEKKNSRKKN